MKEEKRGDLICVNGVRFTPDMLETMRFWYENDNYPRMMIDHLTELQGFIIDAFDDLGDCRGAELTEYLRTTRFMIRMMRPFVDGGLSV